MSSLLQYAKSELREGGVFDDDMWGQTGVQIIAMLEAFSAYDTSGGSASVTLVLFDKLVRRLPINPLTGEDSEWDETDTNILRNNRCPTVFKDGDVAWDSAIGHSPITFPYMPIGPGGQ
jgi:hypothetical protein